MVIVACTLCCLVWVAVIPSLADSRICNSKTRSIEPRQ